MSYEVLITVEPPEHKNTLGQVDYPPTEGVFKQWARDLSALVKAIGGSRALDVYGPGYLDWQGHPAPQAQVNIWTDEERLETWTAVLEYIAARVTALESAGYDVSGVDITPARHFVAIA